MFVCSACQSPSPKWSGQCPQCHAWNTLQEQSSVVPKKGRIQAGKSQKTEKILSTSPHEVSRYTSQSQELDMVLGGGLLPGSLILLSWEPGIGKSTLALQMSDWYTRDQDRSVLYVSGEENTAQISGRAHRLGIQSDQIDLLTDVNFESIIATIEVSPASIVIIDSLSVLSASSLDGAPGSISQIRAMTEVCMQVAKKTDKSIIIIGHVTKDGSISGPKSLEHLVDVVLFLEWIRTEDYRILRALKNRFGSTDAVGLFRMEERGLVDLSNPGMEFIDEKNFALSGSALTITLEGNRPLLIEIEALTTYTKFWYPKRSSRWVNLGKLELLIAVMSKYTDIKLEGSDVYLNIARWLSIHEPGVDLACLAAIKSSKKNTPLGRALFFGEISLTGVIKNVFLLERRLAEWAKLGFTHAYIPERYDGKVPTGMSVTRIWNIADLKI